DNQTDEGLGNKTCGIGACRRSVQACVGGQEQVCTPGNPAENDITCNGVDDDCNDQIDEGYATRQINCGIGACVRSVATSCVGGHEDATCIPGNPAEDDATCDGVDDDCDGINDEDCCVVDSTRACTNQLGECQLGVETCLAGGAWSDCSTLGEETLACDGKDNDCDGQTDEDYVTDASCGVGLCHTRNTPSTCVNGVVTPCHAGNPIAGDDRTCDGVDDDCDGVNDEDFMRYHNQCGAGACFRDVYVACVNGAPTQCVPGEPTEELCGNGIDDDCDYDTDEPGCIRP
ncbi:hypothetical protein KKA13_03975, partial [Patescibacteria group bacterium]|nr:hypothetical protein [Patescibacteria group bacterium]